MPETAGAALPLSHPHHYFSLPVIEFIRRQISSGNGNEVLFHGHWDDKKQLVVKASVLSRGNRQMTAALMNVVKAGDLVIHNHPSGKLTPSDADVMVASELGSQGVGSLIVNNQVTEVYAVVEPLGISKPEPVDPEQVKKFFQPAGRLAERMPSYEYRLVQEQMAVAVNGAFNRGGIVVIEAGTGVGKSLGYLIPAALWSLANEKRVVVSTNTINLQEQLLQKDLPLLTDHLDIPVKAALVKGRGNYLCRRKIDELEADATLLPGLEKPERDFLGEIIAWSQTTSDGSLADLPVMPSHEVWELCSSEADICLGAKCPHYESCFFYRARRRASTAQLLIVNHHLLFADLGLPAGFGLLPKYEAVVLDEAHHLEDVATGYLGENSSRLGLVRSLGRLARRQKANAGVLARIYQRLQKMLQKEQSKFLENLLSRLDDDILPAVGFIAGEVGDLFSRWQAAFLQFEEDEKADEPGRSYKRRITESERGTASWREEIIPLAVELRELFTPLLNALVALDRGLEEGIRDGLLPVEQFDFLLAELRGVGNRLRQHVGVFSRFFLAEERDPGLIYWVEITRGRRLNLKVIMAPLDVGAVLVEKFYARLETVVMTSATLAVGRDFGYFLDRSGLSRLPVDSHPVDTLLLDSPFDYRKNCRLLVPRDLPLPGDGRYLDQLSGFLAELIETVGGRTMILFTSYRMMNQVASRCRSLLSGRGFLLFQQGEGQRHQLLHDFKNNPAAVLLATASFWEGVDVKGRALETLVIVRLPFKVPTEPVVQARSEFIQARGGDPFRDYALPQAAIRLKQGVGRLIRSQNDRGLVVIADERIVTKNYGLKLRESLPMQGVEYQQREKIIELAGEFFRHD